MVKINKDFDGKKFAKKFDLDPETDFTVRLGELIVPSMPDLTEADISDCVADAEPPVTFDEFMDAFSKNEKGDKKAMDVLIEKYEKQKLREVNNA